MEEKTKTLEERKVEALELIAKSLNTIVENCITQNGICIEL